jgi:hypothetical protein
MTSVTIRVLQGTGQGRVYSRLQLPVSLGREDGNSIQLNDDQISRSHAKIQEHSGRLIITDLESTNHTYVNGHEIQMRILQIGDIIKVGRCVLLLSERQEAQPETPSDDPDPFRTAFVRSHGTVDDDSEHMDFADPLPGYIEDPLALFPNGRPEVPCDLEMLQRIQLSDLLSHLHERVGVVIKAGKENLGATEGRMIEIDWDTWTKLIALQVDLSEYIDSVHARQPSK